MVESVKLGNTDLTISRLGFGAARIGEDLSQTALEALFGSLIDNGITFVDTADCYVNSEELIGRYLKKHISEIVVATKCGCIDKGDKRVAYSPEVIKESIDRSLTRMGLECLDLVYLHTCSSEVLQMGEATGALQEAVDAGKVRYLGYSGDDVDALLAIEMGVFDVLQVTFNILNQVALEEVLPAARNADMGVVAKRPIANARLLSTESPQFHGGPYWEPIRSMLIEEGNWNDPLGCALRFTLSHPEISSAIIGTTDATHLYENVERALADPLPDQLLVSLHELSQS